MDIDNPGLKTLLKEACGYDTCYPACRPAWSHDNRTVGHCLVTSRYLQEQFGGELVMADVITPADPPQTILHFFNRIGGVEIDRTWEQFPEGSVRRDYDMAEGESRALFDECLTDPEFRERYRIFKYRIDSNLGM